jgi:hypothetical protein
MAPSVASATKGSIYKDEAKGRRYNAISVGYGPAIAISRRDR